MIIKITLEEAKDRLEGRQGKIKGINYDQFSRRIDTFCGSHVFCTVTFKDNQAVFSCADYDEGHNIDYYINIDEVINFSIMFLKKGNTIEEDKYVIGIKCRDKKEYKIELFESK